nr:methylthioribose-1-phosphate isomerase [Tanacetum cinerariifolium]
AAPLTSVDLLLSSGDEIVIEERSATSLISGIITEKGVITKSGSDSFDIKGFVQKTMSSN